MPTCKPLRAWLATSTTCRRRSSSTRACGWNEPTRDRRRARCAPTRPRWPSAVADALEACGEDRLARGAVARGRRGRRARRSTRSSASLDEPTEPGLHAPLGRALRATATSSTPPRACRSATRRPFCRLRAPTLLFLANRGANGIDGLVSSGIGAAAASGRPTVIVTGDLGLLHDSAASPPCATSDTPVRIVVIDNDGGGIFDFLPQAYAAGPARSSRPCSARRAARPGARRRALRPPPPAGRLARRPWRGARCGHRVDRGPGRPRDQRGAAPQTQRRRGGGTESRPDGLTCLRGARLELSRIAPFGNAMLWMLQ